MEVIINKESLTSKNGPMITLEIKEEEEEEEAPLAKLRIKPTRMKVTTATAAARPIMSIKTRTKTAAQPMVHLVVKILKEKDQLVEKKETNQATLLGGGFVVGQNISLTGIQTPLVLANAV